MKTMLATNHDAPAWSRVSRALRQQEPPKNQTDLPVDTERLIWDQEYREEMRTYLKTGSNKS